MLIYMRQQKEELYYFKCGKYKSSKQNEMYFYNTTQKGFTGCVLVLW